ncbi:MAG: hypothetical protein IKW79_06875, partial [Schwartzia sp.]|nr:hypothetical protein [Schwartzia sp. (in: firmicutes)]
EGTICGIESTDERIERAKALIFSDISALQNDELCHGVFLEEFSMGWAFTQEGFWLGDSAGQKDCILYKDIYGVHLSEYEHNPFICCLELRSKKENLEHQGSMNYHDATFIRYKLETNNTKPIVPSTVVEKIGGYWWKIYEYRKAI